MPDSSNIPSTSSAISSLLGSTNVDDNFIRNEECIELIFNSIFYVFDRHCDQWAWYDFFSNYITNNKNPKFNKGEFEKVKRGRWAEIVKYIFGTREEHELFKDKEQKEKWIGEIVDFCLLKSFSDIVCRFVAFIFSLDSSSRKPMVDVSLFSFFFQKIRENYNNFNYEDLYKNLEKLFSEKIDSISFSISIEKKYEKILIFFIDFYYANKRRFDINDIDKNVNGTIEFFEKFKLDIKIDKNKEQEEEKEKKIFLSIHNFVFGNNFWSFSFETKKIMKKSDCLSLRKCYSMAEKIEGEILNINETFIKELAKIRDLTTIRGEAYRKIFLSIHSEFFIIKEVISYFEKFIDLNYSENTDCNDDVYPSNYNYLSSVFPFLSNSQSTNYNGTILDLGISSHYNQNNGRLRLSQSFSEVQFVASSRTANNLQKNSINSSSLFRSSFYFYGNHVVNADAGNHHVLNDIICRAEKSKNCAKIIGININSEERINYCLKTLTNNFSERLFNLFKLKLKLIDVRNELLLAFLKVFNEYNKNKSIFRLKEIKRNLEKSLEEKNEEKNELIREKNELIREKNELIDEKNTMIRCNREYVDKITNFGFQRLGIEEKRWLEERAYYQEELTRVSNLENEFNELARSKLALGNELQTVRSEKERMETNIAEKIGLLKKKNEELFGVLEEEIQSKERRIKSLEEEKKKLENELKSKKNDGDDTYTAVSSKVPIISELEENDDDGLKNFFSEVRFFLNSILNNKRRDLNSYINILSNHKVVSASLFIFLFFSLIIIFRVLRFMIKKIFGRVNKKKVVVNLKKK